MGTERSGGATSSAAHDIADFSSALGADATRHIEPAVARAWIALLVAYGRLTRALSSELMDASGMSLADFDVLAQLARADGQRLRMSELADAVLISKSGLTRRIDRMAVNGWVRRQRCAEDGRVFWAQLSPRGLKAFRDVAPAHLDAVARRFGAPLRHANLERLTADLDSVAAANAERPVVSES